MFCIDKSGWGVGNLEKNNFVLICEYHTENYGLLLMYL